MSWPGADTAALEQAGIAFRTAEEVLGPEGRAAVEATPRSWARVWARLPLLEGRSFRDLVAWREESLLFTAEGFLLSATAGPRCARIAELGLRLLEALAPSELDVCGLAAADAVLLSRAATVCGVLCHGEAVTARPLPADRAAPAPGALRRLFGIFRPRRAPVLRELQRHERPLVVLVEREEDGAAVEPLLRAAAEDPWTTATVVPTAALSQLHGRTLDRRVAEAESMLRSRLAALKGTPAVAASHVHRGVGFADLAAFDLEALLLRRLPEAVRTLEAAVSLFETVRPGLVALLAPDRDLRRTLGMAAEASGTPWAALRAGDADEGERSDGGPRPTLSLPLAPGEDGVSLLARLREVARDRVGPP